MKEHIVAVVIFLVGLIGFWIYLGRLPKKCSACGKRSLVELYKKPSGNVSINIYDGSSSGVGGAQTSIRIYYDIRYRCEACGEEIEMRLPQK